MFQKSNKNKHKMDKMIPIKAEIILGNIIFDIGMD